MSRFEFVAPLNSTTRFRLDDKELTLSPWLTFLITVLAADELPCEDHLVGWKPRPEIPAHFAKQSGTRLTNGYLNGLLSRLRRELLDQAGLVAAYVRQDDKKGLLRLALRRRENPTVLPPRKWLPGSPGGGGTIPRSRFL